MKPLKKSIKLLRNSWHLPMNSRKLFMYWISLPYELFLTFIYQCYNKRLLHGVPKYNTQHTRSWMVLFLWLWKQNKNTNYETILKSAQLVGTYIEKCTMFGNICTILENGCSFDCKGQLISKEDLKVFIWTKNQGKYFCISALASKLSQLKKIMAHYRAN